MPKGSSRRLLTPDEIKMVEKMAGLGATVQAIADELDMSIEALRILRIKTPEVDKALRTGKSKLLISVSGKAYQKAMQGDNYCIGLILKCQGGWSEKQILEVANDPLREELKGMSEEQLLAFIDNMKGQVIAERSAEAEADNLSTQDNLATRGKKYHLVGEVE